MELGGARKSHHAQCPEFEQDLSKERPCGMIQSGAIRVFHLQRVSLGLQVHYTLCGFLLLI